MATAKVGSKWVYRVRDHAWRGLVFVVNDCEYGVHLKTANGVGELTYSPSVDWSNDFLRMPTAPEKGMRVFKKTDGSDVVPVGMKGTVTGIIQRGFDVQWENGLYANSRDMADFGARIEADPAWVLAQAERAEKPAGFCVLWSDDGKPYRYWHSPHWCRLDEPERAFVWASRIEADAWLATVPFEDCTVVPAPPEAIAAARKRETLPAPSLGTYVLEEPAGAFVPEFGKRWVGEDWKIAQDSAELARTFHSKAEALAFRDGHDVRKTFVPVRVELKFRESNDVGESLADAAAPTLCGVTFPSHVTFAEQTFTGPFDELSVIREELRLRNADANRFLEFVKDEPESICVSLSAAELAIAIVGRLRRTRATALLDAPAVGPADAVALAQQLARANAENERLAAELEQAREICERLRADFRKAGGGR